jgi:predicted SAM-dependent methyltransferase
LGAPVLTEAGKALEECSRVLRPEGIMRIDVPDHDETMRLFRETGDEFYIRHLLGPRKTLWGYHLASYTPQTLKWHVEEHGYELVDSEPNIHLYPQFCLRFKKL